MNTPLKHIIRFLARPGPAAAAILLSLGLLSARAAEPAAPPDDGAEVLTRGPVHEGFAETITFKPTPGVMVPRAAPALIEELPPDQRPAGDNISWIPGYWAWDDEGNGFIWVSGIWRNLPPGRQWMPGYWSESGAEFQWVSGYWADAAVEEVEYLREPPESREAGPNIKAPSRNHSWMPGSWAWRDSRYLWRPGYWDLARPDWVWVPSHYVRTPRGYIYVDGYYDYNVARRGMIFAPVRFSGDHYARPDYYYRPTVVIGLSSLVEHLFLRPRHRHYYFGDYYAPEYRRSGYYASYSYYSSGHGYDPIYAHDRWSHRDDDRWERRREENFLYYRENRDERPPHTLAAFQQFNARAGKDRRVAAGYVTPLAQLAGSKENPLQLKAVNEEERQQLTKHGREIRNFSDQRRKLGIKPDSAPDNVQPGKEVPGKTEPVRVKIPRSPVVAKVSDQPAPADTPPPRPAVIIPEDKPGKSGGKPRRGDQPQPTPDIPPGEQPGKKPKVNPKENPNPEPNVAPKPEPKDVPKMEPKREPRPEPKVEPKREPRPEPKGEPKREPRPEPKVEPKREPRPEPKVVPKREPRPEPKVEPKREPRPEPKVEPKGAPKAEPEDKDKKSGKEKEKPGGR